MKQLFAWLSFIDHPVDDVRRRGQVVIGILCSLLVIAVMGLFSLLGDPVQHGAAGSIVFSIGLFLSLIFIVRRGDVALGGWLVVLATTLSVVLPQVIAGFSNQSLAYALIPALIAGVVFRPWQILLVAIGLTMVILGMVWMLPPDPQVMPTQRSIITHASLMTFVSAIIGFVASDVNHRAFKTIRDGQHHIAQQHHDLMVINRHLAQQADEQTAAVATTVQHLQERTSVQERLLATVTLQRETIRAMSIPVLPVAPQVVVIPLIGVLDSARLVLLRDGALAAIQRYTANHLILDMTGVEIVDSQVASGMMQVIQAAHLLGTHMLLVGVRPEVAQTMVALGLDLGSMDTAATVYEGVHRIQHTGSGE